MAGVIMQFLFSYFTTGNSGSFTIVFISSITDSATSGTLLVYSLRIYDELTKQTFIFTEGIHQNRDRSRALMRWQKLGHCSIVQGIQGPLPIWRENLFNYSISLKCLPHMSMFRGSNPSSLWDARWTALTSNSFYKAENVSQALYGWLN